MPSRCLSLLSLQRIQAHLHIRSRVSPLRGTRGTYPVSVFVILAAYPSPLTHTFTCIPSESLSLLSLQRTRPLTHTFACIPSERYPRYLPGALLSLQRTQAHLHTRRLRVSPLRGTRGTYPVSVFVILAAYPSPLTHTFACIPSERYPRYLPGVCLCYPCSVPKPTYTHVCVYPL